ncbi:MAG TPA: DEDD exonuclease domain-containing protein [Frankiaceae bacterium]|nr:DEDD exonuclease domain-containing protein [Frankiaceae bacterium]
MGFLRAACERGGYPWPGWQIVDTVKVARRVLTCDEAPDCRLATLARLFHACTEPCHRALADARATVDVLHGLFERLGGTGVRSLPELRAFCAQVSPEQRRKRHLADELPATPGVYLFRDGQGRVLYVGKAGDLRARVRTYFTAGEPRARMAEMVGLAERVDTVPCAHALEAEVRELRLIAEHAPRYNRRSRHPERAYYLKVTVEPFPRLSLVRALRDDGGTYLGPFGSGRAAELAAAAIHEAFPLRRCGGRLSARRRTPACALAGMGRCGAPCEGRESREEYARHVAAVVRAVTVDASEVVAAARRRIELLCGQQRYEEATVHRDRLAAFLRGAARLQRLSGLTRVGELVAAVPAADGGWELAVVRHGRLVAAGVAPPGAAARPYVDALRATAESVAPGPGPTPCASAEETECVLRWLGRPGARLVELSGEWSSPALGAGRLRRWVEAAARAREAVRPAGEARGPRPAHRPARRGHGSAGG